MIKCKVCGELKSKYCKGMCKQCYSREKNKHYLRKSNYIKIGIADDDKGETFSKDVLTRKEANKYAKYKRDEILADMLKNPKKYLDES